MNESSNINLLNKAFDIIELLTNNKKEMGVTEISRNLGLVKSGTFRILNTLKDRGFIFQNPRTKAYGLGIKFYFVGSQVQLSLPLCVAAKKVLNPLALDLKENLCLSIPFFNSSQRNEIIIVHSTNFSGFNQNIFTSGMVIPSNTTAMGKCILANMSDSELQNIKGSELPKLQENTIVDWDILFKQIENIRNKKVAFSTSEHFDSIMDIAVCVYDSMHYPIGSLSIVGHQTEIKAFSRDSLVRKLHAASAKISDCLQVFN